MKWIGRLIAAVLLLTASAQAGIVNNSGSLGADSISVPLWVVDSIGDRVAFDTTADWGYIEVFFPGGDTAATDSFTIRGTNTVKITKRPAKYGGFAQFSYRRPVASLDGDGTPGVYSYTVTVRDSSLALWTVCRNGEFQLYETNDINNTFDQLENFTFVAGFPLVDVFSISTSSAAADSAESAFLNAYKNAGAGTARVQSDPVMLDGDAESLDSLVADIDSITARANRPLRVHAADTARTVLIVAGLGDTLRDVVGDSTSAWKDSSLAMLDAIRDSLQYLVTATGFLTPDSAATLIEYYVDSLVQEHCTAGGSCDTAAIRVIVNEEVSALCAGSGSGPIACSLYVYDDGGNALQGARISLYNSGMTAVSYRNISSGTDINGLSVLQIDASTTFRIQYSKPGGYTPDSTFQWIVTPSSGKIIDTLPMTAYDPGTPALPSLCRLYGNVYTPGLVAVPNALVRACPAQDGAAKAGEVVIVPRCASGQTDADGAFFIDVIMSDSLTYPTGSTTFEYDITVALPDENQSGAYNEITVKKAVTIPSQSTYRIDLYLEPE